MAMVLDIRTLGHPDAAIVQEARAIFFGAWGFLKAGTGIDPEKQQRFIAYLADQQR